VPSVGRLDSNSCSMAAAELCVCSTRLPALDLCLNGYSSPALPQEGSAVLEHAPGALYDQHRPAVLQDQSCCCCCQVTTHLKTCPAFCMMEQTGRLDVGTCRACSHALLVQPLWTMLHSSCTLSMLLLLQLLIQLSPPTSKFIAQWHILLMMHS